LLTLSSRFSKTFLNLIEEGEESYNGEKADIPTSNPEGSPVSEGQVSEILPALEISHTSVEKPVPDASDVKQLYQYSHTSTSTEKAVQGKDAAVIEAKELDLRSSQIILLVADHSFSSMNPSKSGSISTQQPIATQAAAQLGVVNTEERGSSIYKPVPKEPISTATREPKGKAIESTYPYSQISLPDAVACRKLEVRKLNVISGNDMPKVRGRLLKEYSAMLHPRDRFGDVGLKMAHESTVLLDISAQELNSKNDYRSDEVGHDLNSNYPLHYVMRGMHLSDSSTETPEVSRASLEGDISLVCVLEANEGIDFLSDEIGTGGSETNSSGQDESSGAGSVYQDVCGAIHSGAPDAHKFPQPILDPIRRALVDRVMDEFWIIFSQMASTDNHIDESSTSGSLVDGGHGSNSSSDAGRASNPSSSTDGQSLSSARHNK
jgi:hypothetical protein